MGYGLKFCTQILLPGLMMSAVVSGAAMAGAVESDPRGAVFCQWDMAVTMKTIAEACFKGRDEGSIATLDWAIGEMDAFILRNSTMSKNGLEAEKTRFRSSALKSLKRNADGTCEASQDALIFFPRPDRGTNNRIRIWIKDLLAVERPPLWNPCL
jgi:hypothetical protein